MRMYTNLNNVVFYHEQKGQHSSIIQPWARDYAVKKIEPKAEVKQLKDRTKRDIKEVVKKIDEPRAEVQQLKDRTKRDIDEVVKQIDEPKAEVKQLRTEQREI